MVSCHDQLFTCVMESIIYSVLYEFAYIKYVFIFECINVSYIIAFLLSSIRVG